MTTQLHQQHACHMLTKKWESNYHILCPGRSLLRHHKFPNLTGQEKQKWAMC